MTLCIKQYRVSRLSVFNCRPESLQIIHAFVAPRFKWCGLLQVSVLNNAGEYQLSAINNIGELIKNWQKSPRIRSQIQKGFRYRVRRSPFLKKIRDRHSRWTVPVVCWWIFFISTVNVQVNIYIHYIFIYMYMCVYILSDQYWLTWWPEYT